MGLLTLSTLIESVRTSLGTRKLTLEIEDGDIVTCAEKALRFARPYAYQTAYVTLLASGAIDLKGYRVVDVVRVFRAPSPAFPENIFNLGGMESWGFSTEALIDGMVTHLHRRYRESVVSPGFKFINGVLYLDNFAGNVTIEYLKEIESLEGIEEEYIVKWVEQYTLALCKEVIGRVRGKFTPANAPYTLDAETLLSEGVQERERLESDLREGFAGFFTVL